MKKRRLPALSRRGKLIRNAALAVLALLVIWVLAQMPALGREAAFRRALREALLPQSAPFAAIRQGTGQDVLFARVGGDVAHAAVTRVWGPLWRCETGMALTAETDGVYILSLRNANADQNTPAVAVLAEGETAELTLTVGEERMPLVFLRKEDGVFLFGLDADRIRDGSALSGFCTLVLQQMDSAGGLSACSGSFTLRTFDAGGALLRTAVRTFGPPED